MYQEDASAGNEELGCTSVVGRVECCSTEATTLVPAHLQQLLLVRGLVGLGNDVVGWQNTLGCFQQSEGGWESEK